MDRSCIYRFKRQFETEETKTLSQACSEYETSDVEQFGWTWDGNPFSDLGEFVPIPEWLAPVSDTFQLICGMIPDHFTVVQVDVDQAIYRMSDSIRLFKSYTMFLTLGTCQAAMAFYDTTGKKECRRMKPGDCLVTCSVPRLMWGMDVTRRGDLEDSRTDKLILVICRTTHKESPSVISPPESNHDPESTNQ